MAEQQEKQFANMSEVVMKKDELIKALVENKAKHDALFDAAVAGYWTTAKAQLDEKRKQLYTALDEFQEDAETQLDRVVQKVDAKEILPQSINVKGFTWSSYLSLAYPANHTTDYERAIRMMSASVYDEVKLSVNEFDRYVMNNWEWKNQFVASNSLYITTGVYYPRGNPSGFSFSGCAGPVGACGPKGDVGNYYNSARENTFNHIFASGFNGLNF